MLKDITIIAVIEHVQMTINAFKMTDSPWARWDGGHLRRRLINADAGVVGGLAVLRGRLCCVLSISVPVPGGCVTEGIPWSP